MERGGVVGLESFNGEKYYKYNLVSNGYTVLFRLPFDVISYKDNFILQNFLDLYNKQQVIMEEISNSIVNVSENNNFIRKKPENLTINYENKMIEETANVKYINSIIDISRINKTFENDKIHLNYFYAKKIEKDYFEQQIQQYNINILDNNQDNIYNSAEENYSPLNKFKKIKRRQNIKNDEDDKKNKNENKNSSIKKELKKSKVNSDDEFEKKKIINKKKRFKSFSPYSNENETIKNSFNNSFNKNTNLFNNFNLKSTLCKSNPNKLNMHNPNINPLNNLPITEIKLNLNLNLDNFDFTKKNLDPKYDANNIIQIEKKKSIFDRDDKKILITRSEKDKKITKHRLKTKNDLIYEEELSKANKMLKINEEKISSQNVRYIKNNNIEVINENKEIRKRNKTSREIFEVDKEFLLNNSKDFLLNDEKNIKNNVDNKIEKIDKNKIDIVSEKNNNQNSNNIRSTINDKNKKKIFSEKLENFFTLKTSTRKRNLSKLNFDLCLNKEDYDANRKVPNHINEEIPNYLNYFTDYDNNKLNSINKEDRRRLTPNNINHQVKKGIFESSQKDLSNEKHNLENENKSNNHSVNEILQINKSFDIHDKKKYLDFKINTKNKQVDEMVNDKKIDFNIFNINFTPNFQSSNDIKFISDMKSQNTSYENIKNTQNNGDILTNKNSTFTKIRCDFISPNYIFKEKFAENDKNTKNYVNTNININNNSKNNLKGKNNFPSNNSNINGNKNTGIEKSPILKKLNKNIDKNESIIILNKFEDNDFDKENDLVKNFYSNNIMNKDINKYQNTYDNKTVKLSSKNDTMSGYHTNEISRLNVITNNEHTIRICDDLNSKNDIFPKKNNMLPQKVYFEDNENKDPRIEELFKKNQNENINNEIIFKSNSKSKTSNNFFITNSKIDLIKNNNFVEKISLLNNTDKKENNETSKLGLKFLSFENVKADKPSKINNINSVFKPKKIISRNINNFFTKKDKPNFKKPLKTNFNNNLINNGSKDNFFSKNDIDEKSNIYVREKFNLINNLIQTDIEKLKELRENILDFDENTDLLNNPNAFQEEIDKIKVLMDNNKKEYTTNYKSFNNNPNLKSVFFRKVFKNSDKNFYLRKRSPKGLEYDSTCNNSLNNTKQKNSKIPIDKNLNVETNFFKEAKESNNKFSKSSNDWKIKPNSGKFKYGYPFLNQMIKLHSGINMKNSKDPVQEKNKLGNNQNKRSTKIIYSKIKIHEEEDEKVKKIANIFRSEFIEPENKNNNEDIDINYDCMQELIKFFQKTIE